MKEFKFYLLTLLFLLFLYAVSSAQDGQWVVGQQIPSFAYPPISCADSMNAMIAVSGERAHQQILKTEDGGKSWKVVYADSGQLGNGLPRRVKSVSYPTSNFAIAQYDSFYVVRTTDGGKTWSRIRFTDLKAEFSQTGWHGRISMFDEKYGYLNTNSTGPDWLFGTEDGGLTWVEINNKFPNEYLYSIINNVKCLGKGKLICALDPVRVRRSAIAATSDGGKNWRIISDGIFDGYVNLYDFSFVDSLNGFVVGYKKDTIINKYYPLLYRTRDGGFSWEEVKRDVKVLFKDGGSYSISFSDTLNGIMGGVRGIKRTTDGGKTWVSEIETIISDSWWVSRVHGNKGMAISGFGFTMSYELTTKSVESGSEVMGDLSISPNPASTELTVKFGVGVSNVRLSNLLGRQLVVGSTEQNGSINYDISQLSSGLYFITWKEKGLTKSKKFVIQR